MSVRRAAAIDCGTNSIRLLIADVDPVTRALADVARDLRIVRLGEGVDATGAFAPDALHRTFAACREFAVMLHEAGDPPVRFVATSASRDVANRAEFVSGVRELLGVQAEVLSGSDEGLLSFRGATAGLQADARPPFLVVDIGGGSTEFVLGGREPTHRVSVDIGCVRLTERHLVDDPPSAGQVESATVTIDAGIARAGQVVPLADGGTLVGLAGTVTTVAAIALGLPEYDPVRIHHSRIPAADVLRVSRSLLGMTRAERMAMPVMVPGREDVIGAGALILRRVVEATGAAEVLVSEHDLLDGAVLSLVPAQQPAQPVLGDDPVAAAGPVAEH